MAPPRASLLQGDVRTALRSQSIPMMFGLVFLLSVHLVDTYFVGQLGTDALAAMTFTFPVISLVMSISMGLGVGTTAAVARALGTGDTAAVRRLATHAVLLGVLVVAVISVLGIATQRAVFSALGAEDALLPLLDQYMTIWYAGALCVVVPMLLNSIQRASGDARTPALIMMLLAVTNLALAPLLIFGLGPVPALGIRGAAIATVSAQAVTLLVSVYFVGVRMKLIDLDRLRRPRLAEILGSWRQILGVGVPAAVTNALAPVATALLTAIVASQGSAAVAGFGIGSRIEGMLLLAPMALAASLTPFVGQNFGAHQNERVAEGLRLARRFVLLWGLGTWLVLLVAAPWVARVFSLDAAVIDAAQSYLWLMPLGYGASGLVSVASAAFNAVDRAIRSTALSAARSLGLAVPMAWIGGELGGMDGVLAGIAVATVAAGGLALLWLRVLETSAAPKAESVAENAVASAVKSAGASGAPAAAGLGRMAPSVDPGWRALDALLDRVSELDDIAVRARPVSTLGFYLGEREIGHLHRSGYLDLHLPPAIHDQLLAEGRAEHHRHVHEAAWISYRLTDERSVEGAAWLLGLAQTFGRLRRELPDAEAALDALAPSPALRLAMYESAARCRLAAAARARAPAGEVAPALAA
jgi:putative MATE family efflux protein